MVNFKKPIYSLLPLVLLGSLQSTSRATAMYFADSSSYLIFASPLPTGLSSTTSSIGVSSVSILLTSMSDAAAYGLNSNGLGTSISEVHAYSEAQTGGHSFNTLPGSHSATDANSNRYNITFTNSRAVLATLELGWSFHIHAADRSNLGASSSAYASACFSTPTFTTFA